MSINKDKLNPHYFSSFSGYLRHCFVANAPRNDANNQKRKRNNGDLIYLY